MLHSWILVPVAPAAAFLAAAGILLIPRSWLLVLIALLRSVADVGASSEIGTLLPNTAINGALAIVAILASLLPGVTRLGPRLIGIATLAILALSFWTMVAFFYFGVTVAFAGEWLRAVSLVAILILAYRVGADSEADLPKMLNWIVGLPALILIGAYISGFAPTLNPTGRAVGTFGHANQAAAYFAVGVIACIWGYWSSRRKASLIVAMAALVSLLLTQSLGALAAVAAGAVVLFSLNAQLSASRRAFLIFVGLGMVLTLFFAVGASSRLGELQDVDYGDAESDNSLDWRFANWRMLIPYWWGNAPLFGLGFGSTRYEVRPMGEAPHSVPVQLLVETGALGVIVAGVLSIALTRAIRRRRQMYPEVAAALAGVSATVATHALASNWLTYAAALYLTLLFVGVMLGRSSGSGPRAVNTRPGFHRGNNPVEAR